MNRVVPCLALAGMLLGNGSSHANEVINRYLAAASDFSPLAMEAVDAQASWFAEPELRLGASNDDEQGIAFRFRPRFGSERMAQNRIVGLLNRQQSGQLEAGLNDQLYPRYLDLVDLCEIAGELGHIEASSELGQQRLQLQRALAETEEFRIAALQAAEIELHHNQQQALRYRQRLQRQSQSIGGEAMHALQAFLQHWPERVIDWQQMIDSSHQLSIALANGQLDDALERIDFELAQQKLKLARSDSSSWLKFVELKYVERAGGVQETSLGIAIPLGSDDNGISQRAAAVNESGLSLQLNQLDSERRLAEVTRELHWLRDQAELLASIAELLSRQQQALRDANQPALLLDLKSALLNNRRETQQLRLRALRAYIGLLHTTGSLAAVPLRNWLLPNQPRI